MGHNLGFVPIHHSAAAALRQLASAIISINVVVGVVVVVIVIIARFMRDRCGNHGVIGRPGKPLIVGRRGGGRVVGVQIQEIGFGGEVVVMRLAKYRAVEPGWGAVVGWLAAVGENILRQMIVGEMLESHFL